MKIGFSASVYEHAAALIGRTPWEASRDPELVFRAHATAYERYRHFPVVPGIDIYNLEAEAYGCEVDKPDGTGAPAISRHPFGGLDEVLGLAPFDPARAGRIPALLEVARRLKARFPEADVRFPVSGPFSVALNLLGVETVTMAALESPDELRAALEHLVDAQAGLARAVARAGLGVAFFESGAAPPLLSPALFRRVEAAPLRRLMDEVRRVTSQPAACIIGGDTAPIVPDMVATGAGFLICPAETDRDAFLAAMKSHPGVKTRVNLAPDLLVRGTQGEIIAAVDEVIRLAKGNPDVLLGTGALPYETPPENVDLINRYTRE